MRDAYCGKYTQYDIRNTHDEITEQEGFEPPVPFGTTVFKTVALNHSATAPDSGGICYFNVIEPKRRPFEQISIYFMAQNSFCKQKG